MGVLYFFLLSAVVFDVKTFRIPNKLIICAFLSGVLYQGIFSPKRQMLLYIGSMILVFLVLIPIYKIRAIGGGDVKLLSICALFTGYERGLLIVWYSLLIGAVISIFYPVYHRLFSNNTNKQKTRHVIHFTIPIVLAVITEHIGGDFHGYFGNL